MTQQQALQLFEEKKVRTMWDTDTERWYFSIVDVVAVLTESDRPRKYWSDLKKKLQQEGSQLSEKIGQFKMKAEDGKNRDNMTNLEIALNMLAEATTTEISQQENPKGFMESADVAKRGGKAARGARASIEKELGRSVVSSMNAKNLSARKNAGELTVGQEEDNK